MRVLFSPAQRTSAEQGQEHARQLLTWLRQSLGDAWQEEWAEQMPSIPRPLFSTVLREGLEAAARQMAEEIAQLVPGLAKFVDKR